MAILCSGIAMFMNSPIYCNSNDYGYCYGNGYGYGYCYGYTNITL